MANRTALFSRKQAGGVFTIHDVAEHPGDIWFVGSAVTGATDGAGYGRNPDAPFATLDYAIQQMTANQGDTVYLLPNHAETINAAGAIELDKAGINVIGLGHGENRPVITVGSSEDASTVLVSAVDCLIRNVVLQPGNDGVDILLDVNADDLTVEDCEFRSDETNAYQADTYIDIAGGANGADRCTIRRCKIVSITAGATQAINIGAVEDALVIEDCWIDGDFSAAGILSGSVFTSALIQRNKVSNRAAGVHAIEFTAACTGLLVDNRMYGDTLGTILDPGSLKCLGNLETDAIDQAGVDSPRTSAGGFPNDSITAAAIATGAIDADAIADNAIDAGAIAANAITSAKIAAGAIAAATFAAGAIDAAAIAAAAIDAATFAADALQAMQDEAQDAIQGEQLDHLVGLTDGATANILTAVDGSIVSKLVSKVSGGDTSSYDETTDSLEMLSDKLGAFSGDGGAAQDDSAKASLDIVHTAIAALPTDADVNTEVDSALNTIVPAAPTAGSLNDVLSKLSGGNTFDKATDSLEMLSDKAGGFSGDGGAAQDDSVKASLDLAHTDLDAILADTGTDGVVIAAGGIVASKFGVSAGEFTTDGIIVTKATAALPQSTSANIFTVTGLVLLKRIVGYVTVAVGAFANVTKIKINSTGVGATTDLCTTLDINADVADTRYEITGTFANAMVDTVDLPLAKVQVTEIVIPPGAIQLDCAGSDGGTGRVRWSATYVPLEAGAQIVAA